MNKILILIFTLLIPFVGCKDQYEIPLRPSDQSFLVVEGFLNSGPGSTTIVLSRVVDLKDTAKFKPELGATITVEGKDNSSYDLPETSPGNYTINQLPLATGQEYRLYIKTTNGKEYRSDYVAVKQAPAIDSINWKKGNNDIGIYVNAHDPSGQTRYYRWEYDETWEIYSYYPASYKFEPPDIIRRIRPDEYADRCWKHANFKGILTGSSAQLQDDVIFEAPLLTIPRVSEKLSVRYSILVKQFPLTKQAYEFLGLMKKNTESLGTIFDAQPSEIRGNIHSLNDPKELVIGFVSASTFEEKRIFITRTEAEGNFRMDCVTDTLLDLSSDAIKQHMYTHLPYNAFYSLQGFIIGYFTSSPECVDCTRRGGSTAIPSYW